MPRATPGTRQTIAAKERKYSVDSSSCSSSSSTTSDDADEDIQLRTSFLSLQDKERRRSSQPRS
eukprot:666931-Rhodomonas_salina.1